MDSCDKRLGMGREITRRDFVGGVSMAIGASILPACTRTREPVVEGPVMQYPPGKTGLRGSHPGSFEVAHATVDGAQWTAEKRDEHYDLVVVGAGISGLAAAYIHHRDVNPNARILILDNHDDFGGHAKRNEFELDGRLFLSYGGTTFMESTDTYPEVAKQVVRELGIDSDRVNVNGGAIALGHPLGCTGAKLTATLLHEMKRRGLRYGVVSMCIGGGMGAAAVFERS